MDLFERSALMSSLVEEMRRSGSWCGETHVQKAAYLLQDFLGVPLGYKFMLYKHGPFSFELRDEVERMRGYGLLTLEANTQGYGPRIAATDSAGRNIERHRQTVDPYREHFRRAGMIVGRKGVVELERLTTALLVSQEILPQGTPEERAEKLHQLKPHIDLETALEAVRAADALRDATQPDA